MATRSKSKGPEKRRSDSDSRATPARTGRGTPPRRRTSGSERPPTAPPSRQTADGEEGPLRRVLVVAVSLLLGAAFAGAIFVFLGWLQPVHQENEAVELPPMFQIDLANRERPKTKVERPREQRRPPPKREAKKRPQKQKPSMTRRAVTRAPRAATQSVQRISPNLAGLQGLGGLGVGAGSGGGGGLSLPQVAEGAMVMAEQVEYMQYRRQREMIRNARFQAEAQFQDMMKSTVSEIPVISFLPKPNYPLDARKRGIEGYVTVNILVSVEGKVLEHEVMDADPEGFFEEAIAQVLPRWQFTPAKDKKGRPIETWVDYTYEFSLQDAI